MSRRASLLALLVLAAGVAVAVAAAGGNKSYAWHLTPTGSTARLRGVSAVGATTAWASGTLGTVLRTTDAGSTWQSVGPPGTSALQFRDIEAFDAEHAVILSIGETTDAFRVYVTSNGGQTWTQTFVNTDPAAFYDCMAFFDSRRGLAVSDPVGGKFRIIATDDGGLHWHLAGANMPPALPGEFAFAASGQCLVTDHGRRAWLGTGGGAQARVFRSDDGGDSWEVSATPIRSGPTAGIFALAFQGEQHGFAVGGDFNTPAQAPDALAWTADGGTSWRLVSRAPNEYRSGAAWVNGSTAIVVGPTGSNVSVDRAQTWQRFDTGSFDTVDCARGACWAAGEQGRVAYLVAGH
jgi:photosystem II stability/assembly factor-like uncharacterized protein